MFDFIRTHQRLMQFVLLVLIVPSFALIGVSGYSSYTSGDRDLVKIGNSAITMQEFERARSNQMRQMQETSPGGFDPAVLDNPMVRASLLESLIDYRVLASTAAAERFSVSDALLRESIASMPQLQRDGRFSPERYNEALAAVGMTTRDFEQNQRFELALGRVLGPVSQTASVPPAVIEHLEQALTDARTLRLQVYSADAFEDEVSVNDDDIQAWYDAHKQEFEVPEQLSVQYLLLDEAAAMANLPDITDADLQAYYDQNKARFTQAGRVNVSHIQLNVPAGATQEQRDAVLEQATELAAQAQSDSQAFGELAAEHSQDAGTARNGGALGWVTQGTLPPALDRAVFALNEGQISDVIEGPGGYHIFFASEVRPEQVQTLDEVRDTVRQEIQHQLGSERFADMATRLTTLIYDQPDSLEPAAQALSVGLKTANGVTRESLLPVVEAGANAASASPDAHILADVRVRRALFSPQVLNEHHNSGIIEISPDTMLVVRAQELTPAHVPELSQVEDRIRAQLLARGAHEQAVQAGQSALAAIAQDGTAEPGLNEAFGESLTVSRINPQGLDKSVLDAALALNPDGGPAYTGIETADGFVLIQVEDVVTESQDTSGLLAALPAELTHLWGQAEEQAVLTAMRVQSEVELLPEAHEAITNPDGAD